MYNNYCRKLFKISTSALTKLIPARGVSSSTGTIDLAHTCYENINTTSSHPPVIVLHGLLDTKNSWSRLSEGIHFATGRKVINVDARNHGDSQHSSEHTYIHMVQDVKKLIKMLDLPKVTLLGHSMGGRTAMILALLNPEKVSSLIIVDISPVSISGVLTSTFPPVLDFITTIEFKGFTSVNDATTFAKEQLLGFGVTQTDIIDFLVKNIGIKPDKTVGWTCNTEVLKTSFPFLTTFPLISGKIFPGPTLFIGGGDSDFIPEEDMVGIKNYFPQAQLQYVPGVGHNVHEQDPSTLFSLVTKFLGTNKI